MKNSSVNEGISINIGRAKNVEESIITLTSIIIYRKDTQDNDHFTQGCYLGI